MSDRKHLIGACQIAKKNHDQARKNARKAKYEHLEAIYTLLCAAFANVKIMEGMKKRAAGMGIQAAATTSMALLFVKTLSHRSLEPATASQQAMALRGAVLMGIAPEEFAARVPKLGGITKLAEQFKAQNCQKTKKLGRVDHTVPKLVWSAKAIYRLKRLSLKEEGIQLTLQKMSLNGWRVLSVTRGPLEKEADHGH